jgi:hypothetical protein
MPPTRVLPVLLAAATSPLAAQSGRVGDVGEIVVVGALRGCPGAGPARGTREVRIRRAGREITVRPGQRERVVLGDEYRIERHTDVRLVIRADQLGSGTFMLAPQILCGLRGADRTFPPYGTVDTAAYEITRSGEGPLQLGIRAGGAFVRWHNSDPARGPRLLVIAAGNVATVPGTAFAVAADSAAGAAVFFVRDGVVRFPNAGGVTAAAGQLIELRRPPFPARPVDPTRTQVLATAAQDVAAHLALFPEAPAPARRSLFRTPWPYAIALTGVATAYCAGISNTKCGLSPRRAHRGTVLVEIPL